MDLFVGKITAEMIFQLQLSKVFCNVIRFRSVPSGRWPAVIDGCGSLMGAEVHVIGSEKHRESFAQGAVIGDEISHEALSLYLELKDSAVFFSFRCAVSPSETSLQGTAFQFFQCSSGSIRPFR
jgi:hypothetical protein